MGAFLFTVEIAPPHQRGLYGAISLGSAVGGNALGSAVSTILHIALTKEQLASWGWRLPFLAGLLVGAAGLSLHSRVHDSKEFLQLKRHRATSSRPLVDAVKTAKARMLLVFLVAGLWCDGIYTFSVWIVSMQTSLLAQPTPHADLINTLMVILLVIAFPLAGMLADRTSRFATMTAGAVFMAVASVPAFWLLDRGTMGAMVVAQLPLVAGLALFGSVLPSWIVDRFPPALRFSAIGIGYNAAQALLGGTGPLISTALYDTTKTGAGPGAWRECGPTSMGRPRSHPYPVQAPTSQCSPSCPESPSPPRASTPTGKRCRRRRDWRRTAIAATAWWRRRTFWSRRRPTRRGRGPR